MYYDRLSHWHMDSTDTLVLAAVCCVATIRNLTTCVVDHDAFNNQHTYSADTPHRGQSALCCKHRAKHPGWGAWGQGSLLAPAGSTEAMQVHGKVNLKPLSRHGVIQKEESQGIISPLEHPWRTQNSQTADSSSARRTRPSAQNQ